MKVEIKHQPSFSMAEITLEPNEEVVSEAGAMMGKSTNLEMETNATGGLMKSLGRSVLGGESFFMNTYKAGAEGGKVSVASELPGDIMNLQLEKDLYVQSGSFLASESSVNIDTKWGGAKGFFSGTGLILLGASGSGILLVASYGAMEEVILKEGESYVVDTGHIVAFDQDIDYSIEKVAGWKSTFLSGEGIVAKFTGPGKVIMQTRSTTAFIDWVYSKLPKNYQSN